MSQFKGEYGMLIIVSYDVSTMTKQGRDRLRKVSKICKNYGIRVQNSVFECIVDIRMFEKLKTDLFKVYNKNEDSIRIW